MLIDDRGRRTSPSQYDQNPPTHTPVESKPFQNLSRFYGENLKRFQDVETEECQSLPHYLRGGRERERGRKKDRERERRREGGMEAEGRRGRRRRGGQRNRESFDEAK